MHSLDEDAPNVLRSIKFLPCNPLIHIFQQQLHVVEQLYACYVRVQGMPVSTWLVHTYQWYAMFAIYGRMRRGFPTCSTMCSLMHRRWVPTCSFTKNEIITFCSSLFVYFSNATKICFFITHLYKEMKKKTTVSICELLLCISTHPRDPNIHMLQQWY